MSNTLSTEKPTDQPQREQDSSALPCSALCHDCAATPGELHGEGCDIERCPDCGGQIISCGCEEITHDRIPWDGEWPGVKECRELDLWCRWGPPWIPCDRNHPDATEDLNRLHEVAVWSADERRWIRKPND